MLVVSFSERRKNEDKTKLLGSVDIS